MKKRIAVIIAFTISICSAWAQTAKPSTPATHWGWILIITPQTTKHSLDSVTIAWQKDSIILKFSTLKYNKHGKLAEIKGSLDVTAKGQHASGTFAPDKLESLEIKASNNPGPGVSIKEK